MDITIQDLYKGKPTVIKNKEFYETKYYVEPFIDRVSKFTDEFLIQVKTPDQMTLTKDTEDITYNRVLIQAILPEKYTVDNHDEVLGFLYGIDVRKPVVKIYRGYLNRACTNLSVFDPTWIDIQELVPGEPINFSSFNILLEKTNNFPLQLQKLKETYVSREDRELHLGQWVDFTIRESFDNSFGKVKLAVSTAVDAYKALYVDQESKYFIPEGIDPTLFDVHESFTQMITDDKRDIMNKFEKTLLINRMLRV